MKSLKMISTNQLSNNNTMKQFQRNNREFKKRKRRKKNQPRNTKSEKLEKENKEELVNRLSLIRVTYKERERVQMVMLV